MGLTILERGAKKQFLLRKGIMDYFVSIGKEDHQHEEESQGECHKEEEDELGA